jgi:hypothetical protein
MTTKAPPETPAQYREPPPPPPRPAPPPGYIDTTALLAVCRQERSTVPVPSPCGAVYPTLVSIAAGRLPPEVAAVLRAAGLGEYLDDPDEEIPLGDAVVLSTLGKGSIGPRPLLRVEEIVRLTTARPAPAVRRAKEHAEQEWYAALEARQRQEEEQRALAETKRKLEVEARKEEEKRLRTPEYRAHRRLAVLEEQVSQLQDTLRSGDGPAPAHGETGELPGTK